jgi:ribosome recycling factor
METAKKQQKEGKLSEDDAKRIEKEIQAITDRFIKDIDAHLAAKEKELTTV